MAMNYSLPQIFLRKTHNLEMRRLAPHINTSKRVPPRLQIWNAQKRCLRCNTVFDDKNNSPIACSFHGHTTVNLLFLLKALILQAVNKFLRFAGENGLFSFAPPHQGIDGEWTDRSGVIVYKWNEKDNRPNTGRDNWKKRWSCCAEYDESAPPCRRGWHVSYDDGFTLY
nr:uncharacterized protein LOC109153640 [Ipomoea batatas]